MVVLLAPVEGPLLERLELIGRGDAGIVGPGHVLVGLGEEAAGPAARIIDGLADPRIDGPHHDPDDLSWREELAPVVPLLAHLEKEPLIDLRKREDVGRVHGLGAQLVDLVEDVQ